MLQFVLKISTNILLHYIILYWNVNYLIFSFSISQCDVGFVAKNSYYYYYYHYHYHYHNLFLTLFSDYLHD
jgi:hypothetical protein